MKRLLSYFGAVILAVVSVQGFGQLLNNGALVAKTQDAAPAGKTYVSIPTSPTFSSPNTITFAGVGGNITSGEFGGPDVYYSGDFDQMVFNGVSSTTTKRLKSENFANPDPLAWAAASLSGTSHGIGFTNASRHFEIYDTRTTLRSQGVRHDSPQSTNPPNLLMQNTFHRDHAGAAYQSNVQSAGNHYGNWQLRFVRILNCVGNEGIYLGSTVHENNKTMFLSTVLQHVYVDSTFWDGIQFNNHLNLTIENVTVLNAGRGDVTAQDRALQIENSFYYVTRSLLHSQHGAFAFLSTSGVMENSFVEWVDDTQGLITDMSTNNHNDAIIDEDASTTSIDISSLSKYDTISITTANSGLNYVANVNGLCLRSDASPSTNYLFGSVVSYSGTTLELRVIGWNGSGSHTDWSIEGALIWDNVTFYNPNFTGNAVFQLFENNANIFWQDCIFPNAGTNSVWSDSRASNLGYVIQHFNSTFTDSPNVPAYGNPPESYLVGWERVVTDDYYYNLGWGHRTPTP